MDLPKKNKARPRASSAYVGMVPSSSNVPSETKTPSTTRPSATAPNPSPAKPPAKRLSPQEGKNQRLQQQLEKSITEVLPEATRSNNNGFIVRLAPDSNGKALTITLSSSWYQLVPGEQEAIATALWSQRDDFNFQQLTLKDLQGKTTARNPVVGDQMVILRR